MAFVRGESAVLRLTGNDFGAVIGWPWVVVEDSEDRVVLYTPANTEVVNHRFEARDRRSELIPVGDPGNEKDFGDVYRPNRHRLRIVPAEPTTPSM